MWWCVGVVTTARYGAWYLCMPHAHAAQLLVQQLLERGVEGVVDLQGGLDAWAADVDPSFPSY